MSIVTSLDLCVTAGWWVAKVTGLLVQLRWNVPAGYTLPSILVTPGGVWLTYHLYNTNESSEYVLTFRARIENCSLLSTLTAFNL